MPLGVTTSVVTGGAGFLGSHVVDELIHIGHRVVVIDDLSGGYLENINPKAIFVCGSITDESIISSIFDTYEIDYVFHLAAYAAEGLSHFIRRFNYTNNVLGSANLINAAISHEIKRFVFTSSMSVYGSACPPFQEEMIPAPEDPYAIAKYSIEMDLKVAQKLHGLDYTIFRPHNCYGERQNLSDPYRNVVAIFMKQILTGRPCTIFGDGEQTRAFSYVSDVSPIIARSIYCDAAKNEIFNIGGDLYCTINELLHLVQMSLGKDTGVIHYAPRYEVKHAYSLHHKANTFLNRETPVDLQTGLAKMAEWAKTYDFLKKSSLPPIEVKNKLPSKWQEYL